MSCEFSLEHGWYSDRPMNRSLRAVLIVTRTASLNGDEAGK
jgi:hypothetical protein